MANLKIDLANDVNNVKYFAEMELIRLAQEPNMNYLEKIKMMRESLELIIKANESIKLIDMYFKADENESTPAAQQAPPAPKINPQGSHQE